MKHVILSFVLILSFAASAVGETIGVILPLSGGWATWGQKVRESLELYRDEHKDSFPFEFKFEDEETCNIRKAVDAYKSLRFKEKAKIIVLGCASGTEAIAPIAKTDGTLILSAGFQQSSLFSRELPLVNLALQIGSEGEVLGQFFLSKNLMRIGAIRNPEGDEFVNEIRKSLAGNNASFVFDEIIPPTERDLSTSVTKIRAEKLDGLFLNLDEFQLANLFQALAKQQVKIIVATAYGTEILAKENPALMKTVEGVFYSFPRASSGGAEFEAKFAARFGHTPSINSAFVYDGMDLLSKALSICKADSKRESCLFKKLTSAGQQQGLSGEFAILANGAIKRKFIMKKVSEGRFKTLE